jgi:hypothetical protein
MDLGDAVTFDTTHKINLYEKPLGMFVGSNHHLQCTIFAFALLGDETVDTFEWVFNAFKTCMGTKDPRVMMIGTIDNNAYIVYNRNVLNLFCISLKYAIKFMQFYHL